MHTLRIPPTGSTPEIILNPDGIIDIKGRSMHAISECFSMQIEQWLKEYVTDPAEVTNVNFQLEYISTGNLGFFRSLILMITRVLMVNRKYVFNWYYEEGDNDIIEKGENISLSAGVDFNFILISDPDLDRLA